MDQAAPGEVYNAHARRLGWDARCDAPHTFAWPGFAPLLSLWQDLRGTAALPRRSALTARRLKGVLPDIALYERIATGSPGTWRVRLVGTEFAKVYGETAGQLLGECLMPGPAFRFQLGLDEVMAAGRPLRFIARCDCVDRKFLSGEFCALPLADDQDRPAMVLLCARFSGVVFEDF
ncbi:MAG TPA: PAS domain-containing protein, partial [Rhizomicrobium sp.]